MNWWLADEFTTSRISAARLPDGDRSLDINIDGGPTLGRAFSIYHGQTSVGRLKISPHHKYTSAHPEVRASLEIDWARFFGFAELTGFFHDVASHVTTGDAQNTDAHRSIQSALVKTRYGTTIAFRSTTTLTMNSGEC